MRKSTKLDENKQMRCLVVHLPFTKQQHVQLKGNLRWNKTKKKGNVRNAKRSTPDRISYMLTRSFCRHTHTYRRDFRRDNNLQHRYHYHIKTEWLWRRVEVNHGLLSVYNFVIQYDFIQVKHNPCVHVKSSLEECFENGMETDVIVITFTTCWKWLFALLLRRF